ncbi:MAG: MBL fold metallo-hydrolase [Armatimonadota bacterium]|nr:MBL fold metallo-hydrolase [Armatimonadota bacterium]MDR7469380.1 MBL fold metallo-hydrolase [Armatimonadota bacterium]
MELTYYGHASFLLRASDGTTILMDPYDVSCGYAIPDVAPTAVTISHEHFDHNYLQGVKGRPKVIRGLAREGKEWAKVDEWVGQVRITTVPTFHDSSGGTERGRNAIFIFEVEGLRVVHAGDLGHPLDAEQVRAVGRPDVLLIPVGGHYTVGPAEAAGVVAALNPRLIIPMHYKTEATGGWPIGPVDDFLKGRAAVVRQGQTVSVTRHTLPPEGTVWVLAHAA